MNLKLLSTNSIILIDEMLKNQNLIKMIEYNSRDPLSEPDIARTGALVMNKIIPAPLTSDVPEREEVNVRVFFPEGSLQNRKVLDTEIHFQVVYHNNLWMIKDEDGNKAFRPYKIIDEIVNVFQDRTIDTLGVIHFDRFYHRHVNKDYGVYILKAVMTTI